jgi:hypothetical protein
MRDAKQIETNKAWQSRETIMVFFDITHLMFWG